MEIKLDIPEYDIKNGFNFKWEGDFRIKIDTKGDSFLLKANKDGLKSLANHLLNLAQNNIPNNYHIHLDSFNSLEKGSKELIIQKIEPYKEDK